MFVVESFSIPSSADTSHFSALAFLAFPKTVNYAQFPCIASNYNLFWLIDFYVTTNLTLLIVPILETAAFLA
jgi:hypothetical protein